MAPAARASRRRALDVLVGLRSTRVSASCTGAICEALFYLELYVVQMVPTDNLRSPGSCTYIKISSKSCMKLASLMRSINQLLNDMQKALSQLKDRSSKNIVIACTHGILENILHSILQVGLMSGDSQIYVTSPVSCWNAPSP
ncbi:hypothetical protein QAD02_002942 [Eretmocerus hayati]|uniref:Uncharacterized protein n=1 Tax=Eretmocerus hayati TaxID=131215 RepID=A0ACC2NLB4_9HYME|nr:hypothetical protein QAD02_002942 [Eretmocerus hayati]